MKWPQCRESFELARVWSLELLEMTERHFGETSRKIIFVHREHYIFVALPNSGMSGFHSLPQMLSKNVRQPPRAEMHKAAKSEDGQQTFSPQEGCCEIDSRGISIFQGAVLASLKILRDDRIISAKHRKKSSSPMHGRMILSLFWPSPESSRLCSSSRVA
jgi:hypothetical protein